MPCPAGYFKLRPHIPSSLTWGEALAAPFPCAGCGCGTFHNDLSGYCLAHRRRWPRRCHGLWVAEGVQLLLVTAIMGALEVTREVSFRLSWVAFAMEMLLARL